MNKLINSYNEILDMIISRLTLSQLSKTKIASELNLTTHTLKSRLSGKTFFTFEELSMINNLLKIDIILKEEK